MHPFTKVIVDLVNESPALYDRPRLDYFEFRDRWLPLFNKDSNTALAPLGEWIQGVARGNGYMDVDIIKGGRAIPDEMYPPYMTIEGGELMFTVPGILNRTINVKLDSGRVLDNVLTESQRKREGHLVAGEKYYNEEFIDKLNIGVPVDPMLFEKMNEIFKHFGVERTTFKTVEKTTEASNNVDNSAAGKIDNDLLDFEF